MVLAVDLGVSRLATEIDWLRWQNLATLSSAVFFDPTLSTTQRVNSSV